ncbi:MAG: hypothetical protein V4857_30840 [Pseudomonadota bacterium]
MEIELTKQVAADGSLRLASGNGQFTFRRLCPGALLVTITGNDTGQFGTAALDEIRLEILRHGALELLIDAEMAQLVAPEVSQEWTRFFSASREQLKRVSVLTGSKLINLTVAIAQHLSYTGKLIQIYSDRELFDAALARAGANGPDHRAGGA